LDETNKIINLIDQAPACEKIELYTFACQQIRNVNPFWTPKQNKFITVDLIIYLLDENKKLNERLTNLEFEELQTPLGKAVGVAVRPIHSSG